MSQSPKPEIGAITWTDLTVDNAEGIKDFYSKVVGWNFAPVSMGDYNDYTMNTSESGKTIAGICHARGLFQRLSNHNSNKPRVNKKRSTGRGNMNIPETNSFRKAPYKIPFRDDIHPAQINPKNIYYFFIIRKLSIDISKYFSILVT